MARGRLVSTEASVDPELNSISPHSMLLYLLTIPHLDRDGLIDAHPMRLTAVAAPMRLELREGAPGLIDEWVEMGLVQRYQVGPGRTVLFFKGFRKHQPGLEYGREPASRFPPPPGWTRTRDGLVPDDPELCARLAEGLHGKSQYRAALLKAAGADAPVLDYPEPEAEPELEAEPAATADLTNTSRTVREPSRSQREPSRTVRVESNQIKSKRSDHAVSDDDDALIPPTAIMEEGGVQGGDARQGTQWSEDELRTAAFGLGGLLGLDAEWNGFQAYLTKRSLPTLQMLLEWEFWYLDMPDAVFQSVLDKINSLTGVIRNNMNQGAKAPLTSQQRQRLQRRIAETLVAAHEEPA
jgi:hypothetical protein